MAKGKFEALKEVHEEQQAATKKVGKRVDPAWKVCTHFLEKQVHQDAQVALLREGSGRDMSDLLNELLKRWLDGQSHT